MKNIDMFKVVFNRWREKENIKEIPIKSVRGTDCLAALNDWDVPEDTWLEYNPNRLNKLPLGVVICAALHELGHLKHRMDVTTWEQEVESEYRAEQYAIDIMKKHFPPMYLKQTVRWAKARLGEKKWCKGDVEYAMAYSRIKEYTT